jgi:protein O-GlcNAc transferase
MLIDLLRRAWHGLRHREYDVAAAYRLIEEGALEQAEVECSGLMRSGETLAAAWHARGLIAERRGLTREAVRLFAMAVECSESEPAFRLNLAQALQIQGEPVRAAEEFKRVLEQMPSHDPRCQKTMLLLAHALDLAGDPDAAEVWYRRVLRTDPGNRQAAGMLAFMLYNQDGTEAARELVARGIRPGIDTASRIRRMLMGVPGINESVAQIDRVRSRLDRELDELLAERLPPIAHPEDEVAMTLFFLAYHGRNDRALMEKFARLVRAVYPTDALPAPRPGAHSKKLRIGFVSTYFYLHSIARTTIGLIRGLSRENFEVHVFSIGPVDDPMAAAIKEAGDRYHCLPSRLQDVREAIVAARLDILFFADIGMHPLTYFLAFWRLAPIQMTTWGHPVTTGIDTMDYFVSAEGIETPDAQSHYSETLIRLPAYFQPAYDRPSLVGPLRTRSQLGLPQSGRLYMCAQNMFKLHPDFDAAMRGILERDPGGIVVLLATANPGWMTKLRARLALSLGPLAERVHFAPRTEMRAFLHLVAHADVVLDPFHFGGNNSICEALALGIPIVTLPAPYVRGRFTLGHYREIGVDSCIAANPAEFVDIAVRLGREPEFRAAISKRIIAGSERLFGRRDAARSLGERLLELAETR